MSDGEKIIIADKPLVCSHCQEEKFDTHMAYAETLALFFRHRRTNLYICVNCGNMHWFDTKYQTRGKPILDAETVRRRLVPDMPEASDAPQPSDLTDDLDDESTCLSCGAEIPEETTTCPKCGWSYLG